MVVFPFTINVWNFFNLVFLVKSLFCRKAAANVKNNTPLKQQMHPITKNALNINDANDTIYFVATNVVQSENG